ncbi:type IV pilin [Natrialba swarupiae]|nr:type IV pilin [Natrialba swarupiae]
MVAITVILAAVIAAFVLDLGGSVGQEAQAGVSIDVDETQEEIQIQITSMGNADHVNLTSNGQGGNWDDADTDELTVGNVTTLDYDAGHIESEGTISAVAVINETQTETQVASEDWDF